jgi:hypothetical protein
VRELTLLLGLSSLLRVVLVVQGGQDYWPDERLYTQLVALWGEPRWHDVWAGVIGRPDHLGFALLSAIPAGLHYALSSGLGIDPSRLLMLPALVLAHASVVTIGLVYAIARRTGAPKAEALLAALFMACSTALLYNARHLLPYDAALALALAAVWCGLAPRPARSMACGALASAAFITYNGYWLSAGTAMLVHVFWPVKSIGEWPAMLKRGGWCGAGFVAVPMALMALQWVAGTPLLVTSMRRLAGTITDGYLPEGFVVPWAYLWHAEHALLLLWVWAALHVILDRGAWAPDRQRAAAMWLACAAFIYLALGAGSALVHAFVVMGRQSRQMIPFLCLASAAALWRLVDTRRPSRWLLTAGAVALGVSTLTNFAVPLAQRFPRTLEGQIRGKYGDVDRMLTIFGPSTLADDRAGRRWLLTNTAHLYPPRAPRPVPSGPVALRFAHPLSFLPYQYEGFDPLERQVLRNNDISMRLIDLGAPEGSGRRREP